MPSQWPIVGGASWWWPESDGGVELSVVHLPNAVSEIHNGRLNLVRKVLTALFKECLNISIIVITFGFQESRVIGSTSSNSSAGDLLD